MALNPKYIKNPTTDKILNSLIGKPITIIKDKELGIEKGVTRNTCFSKTFILFKFSYNYEYGYLLYNKEYANKEVGGVWLQLTDALQPKINRHPKWL
jgi:hypothetical protein